MYEMYQGESWPHIFSGNRDASSADASWSNKVKVMDLRTYQIREYFKSISYNKSGDIS